MSGVHSLSDLKNREEEEERRKRQGLFPRGPPSQARNNPDSAKVKVTLWANGFQVDGGPFRDLDAQDSLIFMNELRANRIPRELQSGIKGKRVELVVEDKQGEVYQRGPRYTAFEGSGHRVSSGSTAAPAGVVNLETPGPYLNPNYPKVTVLVKFHDGQKKEIVVNETTRVAAIREFVMQAAPVAGDFDLMAGFPLTPLRNFKLTVQEADIANSSVLQKML